MLKSLKKVFRRTRKGFDVGKAINAGLTKSMPAGAATEITAKGETVNIIGVPVPVSVISALVIQIGSMLVGWLKHRK